MLVAMLTFLNSTWGHFLVFLVAPTLIQYIRTKLSGSANTTSTSTATANINAPGALSKPSRRARLVSFLLLATLAWQLYYAVQTPPNLFYELELPHNVPNFRLRQAIRTHLRQHYGTPDSDLETMTEAAIERHDPVALRMVELWERLRVDTHRGHYCTFGEDAFVQCGDHCRTALDYVAYLAPSIAWEYIVVAVVIGLATSSLMATRPASSAQHATTTTTGTSIHRMADDAAATPTVVNDALWLVAAKEQRRRQARARTYASWALLVGVLVEWTLLALADLDQNDPLGVWPMPFLHDDLSATRHWLLLAVLGGTWSDARPRPLTMTAVDPQRTGDADALVTLMTGELEAAFHRMHAAQFVHGGR
ncbi:hypothetical protein SYNPS1DRAFT_26848 [Syncephalis pseudoplumigaleata]|uniref:Uncharacterized protein n=1 Tax=Syncephalis pseudoplumigaleata TaxID=1712513 RepID=A0A4P9Z735_9FUNG|nr:hypothetical protein SYNPS1DRAFT_26848 [Syncephalis pseudoplumigaleata]|eukprot:RKP27500.1 hypothetical protein SYNPS1DRAFT_26848 [Syncephalis pseudoplumigaleata]